MKSAQKSTALDQGMSPSPLFEKFSAEMAAAKIKPGLIAIALSGGGDSMALVHLMKVWADETASSIIALTVDHNLREGSKAEAAQVAAWMKKSKIPHKILTGRKSRPQSGLMDFARQLRYRLLTDFCKENKITYLLTAHNFEDQVETFLMRLARGSGVDGLAAMAGSSRINGVKIIRPLLEIKRQDLREYLKQNKKTWIEDPTNDNDAYARNRLRKLIGMDKEKSLLEKRLFDTALAMRRASKALQQWAKEELEKNLQRDSKFWRIDTKHFKKLPEEIALRILKEIFKLKKIKKDFPRLSSLQFLYKEIVAGTLKGRTLGGLKISLNKGFIIFEKE